MYDVITVLQYLRQMDPPEKGYVTDTSYPAVFDVRTTGQQEQVLPSLDITRMQLTEDKCTFIVTDLMKTSRPSKHIPPIKLKSYALD